MAVDLKPGLVCAQRYRLEARLGQGGVGLVWSARHLVTGKQVALKFLRGDAYDEARHRFVHEARSVCAIRHVNVIEVHDVLELDDGSPVLVMDLLEGETLGQRLARDKALGLRELADILLPVLSALEAAHAKGIVHRDLKPDNVFLCAGLEPREGVKVLDFGLAKRLAVQGEGAAPDALTRSGAIVGTPYYMSPEQVFGEGDLDARADIWSLGVVLYEGLTGTRPTEAPNVGQILKRVTSGERVDLQKAAPHLPADVCQLVRAMLSKPREQRPANVEQVRAVLARHASGAGPPPAVRRRGRALPLALGAGALVAVAIFGAARGLPERKGQAAPTVVADQRDPGQPPAPATPAPPAPVAPTPAPAATVPSPAPAPAAPAAGRRPPPAPAGRKPAKPPAAVTKPAEPPAPASRPEAKDPWGDPN